MALPNNPTQSEVVKAIKDLETNKADSSALSSYFPKSGGALNSGAVITMTGGNPYLGLKETSGTQYYLQGYQGEVGISVSGNWGTKRISLDANGKVFIPSKTLGDGTYTYTLPNKTGTVAMTSDLPTKTSDLTNDSGFLTSHLTSIDGLAGGQLTSALYLSGGDAVSGAANIQLDTNGQITAKGTTSTLFGRNSSTTLLVGHSSHALTLRGSATRPTYNGNALALSSDIPTDEMTDTFFATCSTAAATKDKVATISGSSTFELRVGVIVGVKFSYTNTFSASSSAGYVTLNVNNTGAKNIYWNNTGTPTGTNTKAFGYANRLIYYMYDGTYWVFLSASTDDNSTGYLSYTATSVGNTDTNTQYLIGKRTVSSNGTNYYNPSIYFKGYNLYSYNVYATSDRRLKENIKPTELNCGKVIDDLQIKEFNFIDDEEKEVVVGAIAQELQEILPEKYRATLVSGSEDTSYSINEGKLLFVAIGALKEERAKTKELEERLARLEAKLGV